MKTQHKQLVNKTLALIACTEVYQVGRNNTRDRLPVGTIFIWLLDKDTLPPLRSGNEVVS